MHTHIYGKSHLWSSAFCMGTVVPLHLPIIHVGLLESDNQRLLWALQDGTSLFYHKVVYMSGCHVHSRDGRCNRGSSRVYHRLFPLHRQKHVYAHLYGTIRFPDQPYCISGFLPLPGFPLGNQHTRRHRGVNHSYSYPFPLTAFFRVLPGLL